MDDLSKEYVISFFDASLRLHGDRPEAVRWSRPGQMRHFESLLDIGRIDGTRVLDFGCGKGDLLQFLMERGIETDYTGVDINENLISLARRKFPGADFRVLDLDRTELNEEFDYILLCGVFNLRVQGIEEQIKRTLERLFRLCRMGLGLNALSDHSPRKDFELHYTNPGDLFRFAVQNLSPYVSLRHDRMEYDFVLFVYKALNLPDSARS